MHAHLAISAVPIGLETDKGSYRVSRQTLKLNSILEVTKHKVVYVVFPTSEPYVSHIF